MVSYNPLKCLLSTFLLSACFPVIHAQLENEAQPEVTIPQGTLLGLFMETRNGRNISAFQKIPYGQPPIGNLRWANPVPADGWNGTMNATDSTNRCAQTGMGGTSVSGDEDCLYLNVYTPQLPQGTNSSSFPVMVYIHGGGFIGGSGSSARLGPGYLLDEDVIFVIANYRLGPFGFLSTGDEVASGNWGLKDQVLALQWVQDNIQYFGGDPDRVTLFGESAGAGAVHLLALSDTTIGLFHQYITQSGTALASWAHRPRAAYASKAFQLGEYVGCTNDTSDSLISCLRAIDVSDIMAAQSEFTVWEFLPDMIFGPTDEPDIEGAFLTDSPSNLFAAGKIRDLPWMAGVVRDEGLVHSVNFYDDEDMLYDFLENFDTLLPLMLCWTYRPDGGAALASAAKAYYFNNDFTSNTSVLLKNVTMLIGDSHFYYPTHVALQQQNALATSPQYFFTFDYRGTFSVTDFDFDTMPNYGVAHGDDVLYLFPCETKFPHLNATLSEADYQMVDTMVQLWTSFAINGVPTTPSGAATWEPYLSSDDDYLKIGNESDTSVDLQYSFFKERMEFWANAYAAVDTEATESDDSNSDSGTVTLSVNLLFVLLVACLKFIL